MGFRMASARRTDRRCKAWSPSQGSKWGASERRYRAMASDVWRLKLLVEPHPATSRNSKDLYGMQEVRGSNPLSSTHFPSSEACCDLEK
jgi:hypothetical protein